MNGLKPIKMPSAKEKVAAELRKAILSRQMKEGDLELRKLILKNIINFVQFWKVRQHCLQQSRRRTYRR